MLIRLKKGRDGPDSLACVREDGTSTWRRIQRGLAFHDLAHHAVETELGIRDGFYGLVATGRSFDALADAEERANIPPSAMWVEFVVNQLLTEAASDEVYDEIAFHEGIARAVLTAGLPAPRRLEAAEIARIRARILALVARWRELPMGQTLELEFAPA